jgi:GAF domain-containing protein
VLQQISASHQAEPAPAPSAPVSAAIAPAAGDDVLAFVSLARLASGAGSVNDVLALSTNLIRHIVLNATGAWFLLKDTGDRVTVADSFGPGAPHLRGLSIALSHRLTGWVASNRQLIVNSDAALDLDDLASRIDPPLKSCLSVPLLSGQKLIGVLSLYSPGREAFDDNQGRLIQMIVPHIAQAIEAALAQGQAPQASAGRDLKIVSRR